jgi:hypothetical protein
MNAINLHRLLAMTIIVGIAFHQLKAFSRSPDVERYQDRIRIQAETIPARIGSWVGEDVPVPVQALEVLRPNVLISRRYVNVEKNWSASILFVHCFDAQHMVGHYPARCYPAEGWQLQRSTEQDWSVGDLQLTGTEYEFTMSNALGSVQNNQDIIVDNCLFRPDGKILRDMESMSNTLLGAYGQNTGSGQLQVIFDAAMPQDQRAKAFSELAIGYLPAIEATLARPFDGNSEIK